MRDYTVMHVLYFPIICYVLLTNWHIALFPDTYNYLLRSLFFFSFFNSPNTNRTFLLRPLSDLDDLRRNMEVVAFEKNVQYCRPSVPGHVA